MPVIKKRPILFNGAMVRAILESRKTVTRRALRTQPVLNGSFWEFGGAGWSAGVKSITPVAGYSLSYMCPLGQPGDRLWVRETWQGPLLEEHEVAANQCLWNDMSQYQKPEH